MSHGRQNATFARVQMQLIAATESAFDNLKVGAPRPRGTPTSRPNGAAERMGGLRRQDAIRYCR